MELKIDNLCFLGFLTLEQLEQRHLEHFDTMCLRLDNRRRSFRWDYVSLAAKYQKISLDERDSLHGERQRNGGSPSRELMSYIKTKYPNHPVVELTKNLKGIGRHDIAEMLEPLVKNTAWNHCLLLWVIKLWQVKLGNNLMRLLFQFSKLLLPLYALNH